MEFMTVLAVAVGISFDTFAVSLSFGVVQNRILFLQAMRVAVIMAIFQAGLFVAGYLLGSAISSIMKAADHWVALVLLSFLGIRMIIEGIRRKEGDEVRDYTETLTLIVTALGTSIDAFAAGISFAFLRISIWMSGLIIGTVTFLASMTAIRIGKSAGKNLGRNVEITGGCILIAIGIKIFLEHVIAG